MARGREQIATIRAALRLYRTGLTMADEIERRVRHELASRDIATARAEIVRIDGELEALRQRRVAQEKIIDEAWRSVAP